MTLRSGWPISQNKPYEINCLSGAYLKCSSRGIKEHVLLGHLRACPYFNYLKKLGKKKKDDFSLTFMGFSVVKNCEMFGNSDSGSVTYFEGPG